MGKTRRFYQLKTTNKDRSDKHLTHRVYPYRRTSRNTKREYQKPKPIKRELLEPFIHNLSSIQLSDIQMSALAKGSKHPRNLKEHNLSLMSTNYIDE